MIWTVNLHEKVLFSLNICIVRNLMHLIEDETGGAHEATRKRGACQTRWATCPSVEGLVKPPNADRRGEASWF